MLRYYNAFMIAVVGMTIAVVTPRQAADAQSGQALVFAEHACLDYGVTLNTAAFESCVTRASRAFDRGEPDLAYMQARLTREARNACPVGAELRYAPAQKAFHMAAFARARL